MGINLGERINYEPVIVALAGPPLSGKTTLGNALSEKTNLNFLDIDRIRRDQKLYPHGERDFSDTLTRYTAIQIAFAYAYHSAAKLLAKEDPVLLAATYSHKSYLDPLLEFADYYQRLNHFDESLLRIFVLEAPEASLAQRVEERILQRDSSNNTVNTVEIALELRRGFAQIKGKNVFHINTGLPIDENMSQILSTLEPLKRFPQGFSDNA